MQIGTIVLYKLSAADVTSIEKGRSFRKGIAAVIDRELGVDTHAGNAVAAGDIFPMVVVRDNGGSVNGQVLLDGNDTLWATSRGEGTEDGEYMPIAAVPAPVVPATVETPSAPTTSATAAA